MSNESEGGSSVRSRIITKEDEEAEFIADSDIEDATSVVSLGTKQHIDTEEFEHNIDSEVSFLKYESQPQQKKGYIDEEIVRNVMKGADERLMDQKMNTTFTRRMKLCAGILGLTVFSLGIATLVVDPKDRSIDKIIKNKGTAYDFHDEDNFIDPELEEGYNFWDKEVFLEPGVIFPPAIMFNLKDTKEGRYMKEEETPFFFQVPFSGSVAQSLMTACLNLVLASNHPLPQETETLAISHFNQHPYVNVNLSTAAGIEDAAKRGLKNSGLADVMVSSHVNYVSNLLFDSTIHKGRLFTVVRHPIDRAIATYYDVITKNQDLSGMTLSEYVHSNHVNDSDWMTRFLTNKRQERIGPNHLQLAKEILRKKCIVGVHDKIEESMQLFEDYFGWTAMNEKSNEICHNEIITKEHERGEDIFSKVGHLIDKESDEYKILLDYNRYDVELYWYAVEVFKEQKEWVKKLPK